MLIEKKYLKTSSAKFFFLFILLIVSWLFISFLLYYLGSIFHDAHLLQNKFVYQVHKIEFLEQGIEILKQTVAKLEEEQEPRRKFPFIDFWYNSNDSIGPSSLQCLGMVVSAIVVLIVCANVWPAPFIILKKGIAESISGIIETKDVMFTAFSTDGSELEWLVKINKNKHLEIFVKTYDGTEFIPVNNYIAILNRCIQEALSFPGYPYHDRHSELFRLVSEGMSQIPGIPL